MFKLSRAVYASNRAFLFNPSRIDQFSVACGIKRPSHLRVQVRCLSVGDVFGKVDPSKIVDLPNAPLPLPPKTPVSELVASGQSVLEELGLFSWFTPPSYIRYALESIHLYADVPWWLSIIIVSTSLRLLTIYVPIMSQRMVAIQSRHKKELKEFNKRMTDARSEGDNMQVHQILLEQHQFMRSKGIKMGRQAVVMLANAGVFLTNFMAIKKMVDVKYPGFETGGMLWFPNLLAVDPYMGLPAISAVTSFVVLKVGIDFGASSDQMSPVMKIGMQYALPVIVFASGWWFSSAICIHWATSNIISLCFSGLFKLNPVRNALKIPPIVKHDASLDTNPVAELWQKRKSSKGAPPSLSMLRKKDYELFRRSGQGKPIV